MSNTVHTVLEFLNYNKEKVPVVFENEYWYHQKIIDKKIKNLVDFINSLKGIETLGSCQGHDNGGQTGEWVFPYIKFKCLDNRSLGLLASIEYIYSDLRNLYGDLSEEELSKIYQPYFRHCSTMFLRLGCRLQSGA